MSVSTVSFDENLIKNELCELVRQTVEGMLNELGCDLPHVIASLGTLPF